MQASGRRTQEKCEVAVYPRRPVGCRHAKGGTTLSHKLLQLINQISVMNVCEVTYTVEKTGHSLVCFISGSVVSPLGDTSSRGLWTTLNSPHCYTRPDTRSHLRRFIGYQPLDVLLDPVFTLSSLEPYSFSDTPPPWLLITL